ncbi:DUF7405 family protein [Millisia brevis]|uniref:DUF7405 family protein n=1 Tax=Millisia brevis TaxID=264148 RepID=UPI0008370A86|nr:hypothetical protein [Millisia brevis]
MSLPERQHAWEETFGTDDLGRPVAPRHQSLVFTDLVTPPNSDGPRGGGAATHLERAAAHLEYALSAVEDKYAYGPDGLLTTVGWGVEWFDRYTDHDRLINPPARMSRWEDPALDIPIAVFHLASDHAEILDEVREVLFGDGPLGQGDYLRVTEVRNGFVGAGLPARALPELDLPESAPLLFGFHSIHKGSQAPEDAITITEGPLTGGTTAHISRIELAVDRWQQLDRDRQAALLYAPTISAHQAERLVEDSPSDYERYETTVREHGVVGHAQAAARARVNNVPVINRRDFATIDGGRPGTHFVSLQRELRDFNNTRATMNAADGSDHHRSVGARRRNGINAFFDVTHRATLGIPARAHRAYPHARGSR